MKVSLESNLLRGLVEDIENDSLEGYIDNNIKSGRGTKGIYKVLKWFLKECKENNITIDLNEQKLSQIIYKCYYMIHNLGYRDYIAVNIIKSNFNNFLSKCYK